MLFALFLVWESRYRHSMLDLGLFRVRNFAMTNLETLIVYSGLIGAFFFVTLFLQQTAGYSPIGGRLATTPDLGDPLRSLAAVRQDRDGDRPTGADVASDRSSAASGCCC